MIDPDIAALVERLRRGAPFICREAADALEACQAEWNKERQIAEAQEITMRGLYQDIEQLRASCASLRETKDTFFRNAEAWQARAEKAEAALKEQADA